MADLDILVKTRSAQQEVSLVANVGWKDISKSVARRNTNVKAEKEKASATGTPREAPQIWHIRKMMKMTQNMHLL